MSTIKVTSGMEEIKLQLDGIYNSIEPLTTDINNSIDKIREAWKGIRSDTVLKDIEEIKKSTINIKDNLRKNIDFIDEAYKKYKELEAASIVQGTVVSVPIETPVQQVVPVVPSTTETPKYTVSPGTMSFYDFENNLLNNLINGEKNGQNSFNSIDMEGFLKTYNGTLNSAIISKDNPNYIQDSANSLYTVQKSLQESGLWGTPSATRILTLWMINTGFKIPVTASTKIDGLGNQRGIGIGNNWNKSGLDCTNFANWLNINSGRIPEGGVLNNPSSPANLNSGRTPLRTGEGIPSGNFDTGDIVSNDNHVGVYLGADDTYIYTFETSRRGTENSHGTCISAVYLDKTDDSLPYNYYGPKYQENYWTFVTKISEVDITDPNTKFVKENVVVNPTNK